MSTDAEYYRSIDDGHWPNFMAEWGFTTARILVLMVALAVTPSCSGALIESATIRYNLTIALLVEGRPVSASVVQELQLIAAPLVKPPLVPSRLGVLLRGEALLVESEDRTRGWVIPLEQRGADIPYERTIFWACAPLGQHESPSQYVARVAPIAARGCDIPAQALPMLVEIPDLRSFAGLARVDVPALAAASSETVTVVSARMELSSEALTSGIANRLPWLGDVTREAPKAIPVQSNRGTTMLRLEDFVKQRF